MNAKNLDTPVRTADLDCTRKRSAFAKSTLVGLTLWLSVFQMSAQPTATPAPGPISINTPTIFTFNAVVPSGGTAINWLDVTFKQSPNATPSATEPLCRLTIGFYYSGAITTYNVDGSSNITMWPPSAWTTPAGRSNAFCSIAAEDQIQLNFNSTYTTLTAVIPITFTAPPPLGYHLYFSLNYQTPGNSYANSASDFGAYTVGSVASPPVVSNYTVFVEDFENFSDYALVNTGLTKKVNADCPANCTLYAEGTYTLIGNPRFGHPLFADFPARGGSGKMLVANGKNQSDRVWTKRIIGLRKGQNYSVEAYAAKVSSLISTGPL